MVEKVLELFCGIGGFRVALQEALLGEYNELTFVPFDVDGVVGQVYLHNFNEKVNRGNIELVKEDRLLGAKIWTMSPPCQPFTTTVDARQLDMEDFRNIALIRLMSLLKSLEVKPKWIFFENVRGFIGSNTHRTWLETLKECGYVWRQYLLNPMHFQIPNHRLRYFLVAARHPEDSSLYSQDKDLIFNHVRPCDCEGMSSKNGLDCKYVEIDHPIDKWHELGVDECYGPTQMHTVDSYLEVDVDESLYLTEKILSAPWARHLSYVGSKDRCTVCFTSSYGRRFNKSSGSFLDVSEEFGVNTDTENILQQKLRFFSGQELLNLFGFPKTFIFPDNLSRNEKFKCVGQSINVVVVRAVIHEHFCRKKTSC